MARQNLVTHTLDDKTCFDRIAAVHYRHREVGENCAGGTRSAAESVKSWMDSEAHRRSILNPRFKDTGIGIATGRQGIKYWTQVFAVPAVKTTPGQPK
jgi:uncharacterized protein YkwD